MKSLKIVVKICLQLEETLKFTWTEITMGLCYGVLIIFYRNKNKIFFRKKCRYAALKELRIGGYSEHDLLICDKFLPVYASVDVRQTFGDKCNSEANAPNFVQFIFNCSLS